MNSVSERARTGAAGFEPVRLPFILPGFGRTSWVSDRAREIWEERLKRSARAWETIEFESVREGLRPAGLFAIGPEDFARCKLEARESGLAIGIVDQVRQRGSYSLSTIEAKDSDYPTSLRVAVGQREAVERISVAHSGGDLVSVGNALGYPRCCCLFFQQQCGEGKYHDTTWPMAVAGHTHASEDFRDLYCEGPPEANTLWRWLGIRAVPHLPCSFDCRDTVELARAWLELGQRLRLAKELEDLVTILSWPVEWSSLHGIAEIKTPILKIITATDAFAYKHTVRRRGDIYPDEGAVGLAFPYNLPQKRKLTSSPGFRRGLAQEMAGNSTEAK